MIEQLVDITFRTETSEGLEEYMEAQKLNFILRKVAKTLTIYETLSQEGDQFTYKFESTFKNHKMVFKLGESFVDKGPDGREMKTTFTVEGDKLVCTQENIKPNDVPCKIERVILPDGKMQVKLISVPTNTVCTRLYSVHKKK
ncbi:fatty acid-binding protein [Elysia marginata]|uniref:Fatty acid-binding protein n=1 Tax=Elysia marginata TaxID=1093978 RepID=A0AAV4GK13_9GAST|nr:fatty acid-binding protein [Elysia marginata]